MEHLRALGRDLHTSPSHEVELWLPRGEWEEEWLGEFFAYRVNPREGGVLFYIDVDGMVSTMHHGSPLIFSPALHEYEPRNERDPEKQPIIVMEKEMILLL